MDFFHVNVKMYDEKHNFEVCRPSSLDNPKDYSVMFLMERYYEKWDNLLNVKNCLVFWPNTLKVPLKLSKTHAVVSCSSSRLEYCRFFKTHNIKNLPRNSDYILKNGAFVSGKARIGNGTQIMPGAVISDEVTIGDNCYIGFGVKLLGEIHIGNYVVIRENSVLGADGLSTERASDGSAISMPQFGGILIGNDVEIGANCVIGRGAIDDTIIDEGCKLDNLVFISHNVHLGKFTFIVGETIMFGGASTGERAYISGNATIRNKVSIGADTLVGMGAVVTKNVNAGMTVLGNPAHQKEESYDKI